MEKTVKENNKFSLIQSFKDVIESMKNTEVEESVISSSKIPADNTEQIEQLDEETLASAVIYEDFPTRKNRFGKALKSDSKINSKSKDMSKIADKSEDDREQE